MFLTITPIQHLTAETRSIAEHEFFLCDALRLCGQFNTFL